jgi:hypothetical protein
VQRLARGAPAGVEVDRFLLLKGVEDQVEVAVSKDDAAPEEGVGRVARDLLEALDEPFVDEGDAELCFVVSVCVCMGGDS